MNKNNKIIIAAIAVVALLLVIGALFASGILSGNDDDKNTASYEVSFIDGDDVIKTLTVKENNSVSRISSPEKEGYIFTGWYSDKELTNEFNFENTRITENTNIYAKWVKASEPEPGDITFTVTFNTDGASSIASQTVKEGEKAVRPADPLKSGYKFEGWYSDSSFTTKFDFKTPITFDITLYAKFTASQGGGGGGGSITPPPVTDKTYSIIYNGNGNDSGIVPDTQISSKNNPSVQISNQNSLSRAGYTFVCWNTEKDGTGTNYVAESSVSFDDLNSDLTLYAKWIIGTYTPDKDGSVIVIINPGQINDLISAADGEIIEVADTSNYTNANTVSISSNLLSDIQKENENKKDISVKTAKGSVQLSSEVVDSIIRTGTNDKNDISIKIDSESDSETRYNIEITAGIGKITQFPETITISIPYTLRDGENPQDISVYYIDGTDNLLVHGVYNKETKCVDIKTNHLSTYEIRNDAKYSINFILNGGKFDGTFKPSDYMGKEFNSSIKTISPSKAGYTFNGWFTGESPTTAWDFDTDTVKTLNDHDPYTINLYAKWEALSYDIIYNLGGGTNSSGNPASYTIESETISFENPTKTGYTFKGWFSDAEFNNQISSIVKGSFEDVTLYASWEKNKYSVTLSSGTGYSLTPLQNNIFVEHDGSFQFKLSINDDFKQSSPVVISNGKTIPAVDEIYTISNISENQVVTVEGIETNTYSITFANKDGFYTVNNDSPVSSGESFIFTITLNDAYNQSILTESSVKVFGKYGSVSKTGENVNQYTITNVTSDLVVLVDGLKKNEYVVTFFSDNDLILEQKVSHGDSAALISNLTKPGYNFAGWCLDADGTTKYSNEAITEDTILYAKWDAGTTSYFVYIYQEKISYTSDANKYELIHADQKSDSVGKTVSVDWETYRTETILKSVNGFEPNESISKTGGVISAENPLILKLYFDRKEFTMTFNAPDGSLFFESISKIKAKYGQPVSPIRVILPEGITLDHWYEFDDDKTPYLFTTMPDRDVTLHSKYTAIYYLEYNANGGAGDLPYVIGYANGTDVILFGPNYPNSGSYILTKEGYTFGGWEYNDDIYQPGKPFTMPSGDVTLNAVWTPIAYNVHFDGNGSTSGSMTDQIFTYDAAQNLTANVFVKTGYTFMGWSETSNGYVKYADQASVSNLTSENNAEVTLYAVWQINQYTIAFNSNGGSSVDSITDDYNASVTLPTPTKEGHAFDGWYSDESPDTIYTSDKMPAENITLYAKWSVNPYKVTFHYNNGTDDTTDSVQFNSSITEPTNISKLGYTLEGWYSDSEFNAGWNFASDKMPSQNIDLYVKWTATFYAVNFYNGTELITSTTYTVESDSIQMPLNLTKTGYTFNGWFDSTLTNEFSYTKGTTVGNIDLYAKFTINKYTITFDSNGGSSAESITDDYNVVVNLPIPTKEGYAFDGWYSDESPDTKYTSDKMPAENITLYAKWTKNSYTLTIKYIYENGSKAHDPHVSLVEYGETYTATSPSIESLLPDIPTVTGTMPANDLTITVTYGDYLVSIDGNNYRTIEDALASAQEGDRLILLRDYTIQKDLTIPKGILLVLPCSDDDAGYDLNAEYEKEHNPDGTSVSSSDLSVLYRTLTVSSNATLNIEGQVLVNAVTGRPAAGHYDMDITGEYSQIILDGNIIVKNKGLLDVCGYIKGEGQITAESGAEIRDLYVVKNWRGGSQAFALFPDVFPFNEYDCHNIQSTIYMESGSSLLGNVKMYASGSYHYTRFPQIDNENGLIRLAEGAHLVKSYADYKQNGSSENDLGRTQIGIYGGATFSHSSLPIVGLNLSTKAFIYPVDGDIDFELYGGEYIIENDFKLLTGTRIVLNEDAILTLNKGNTLVLYDEFNDVKNTGNTEYPDRPASELILYHDAIFNINGKFAGIISFPDSITVEGSKKATVNTENAEALIVDTIEANGYLKNVPDDYPKFVNLHFETKYHYTLSFETNGGLKISSISYFVGDDLEIPTPTKAGCDFEGWYLDSKLTQKYNYEDLTGNTTLYAKWEDSKYIVSFETNKGSSVAVQEILFNNAVTKPTDPTRSGYTFAGWYSDAALTSEYDFNTVVTKNTILYANWDPIEYTISFVTNNGENLDSITYTADDASLNIQELSKTGYKFDKWCTDKELTTGFEFKQYETSGDLTLYAEWVPVVYAIKYYDGTQLNLEPSSYTIEDSITLPAATKSGYEFAGWNESSDLSGNAVFSINEGTTGNKEYYASWNESVYSITYMDGENKIENLSPASYTTSKRIVLPTPSKEGYIFNGWYDDAGFTDKALSIPIGSTGDKTFYASFTVNQYTITFNSNGGSAVDPIKQDYGTTVTKPTDPTKTGYIFAGWYKEENLTTVWNFETDTMPVDGTTLYAKWTPITYTVVFDENGGTGSMESQSFIYDETESLNDNIFTRTGYTFMGWSLSQNATDAAYANGQELTNLVSMDGDEVTLYAVWKIDQYTITFNSNGGSAVKSTTADYNSVVSKPADPLREGYIFAGWFKDEGLEGDWNFETDTIPVDGTTLYAKWQINQYEITFNSNGGSAVTSITADYDTIVNQPSAPTKTGYTFAGWFKDNETFLQEWNFETDTIPVDGTTLYAKWTADSYTVRYYDDLGSLLHEYTVTYGNSVTKPENPTKTGYNFNGWNAEVPGTMPASDLEFHAVFEINTYVIQYYIDGILDKTQEYEYNSKITSYQPESQEGKEFSGWNESLPDTMPDHDIIVSGSFDASIFTITYYIDGILHEIPQSIRFGEEVTPLEVPTKEGYSFSGWDWNGNKDGLGAAPQIMPAENLRVDGYFTANLYNITFHYNNGDGNTTERVEFNSSITKPTNVSKLGYTLEGWYSDSEFNTKWNFESDKMPAKDIMLYAKWDINSYEIAFNSNGGSAVDSIEADYNVTITEPSAPTKTGYTFAGWFKDNETFLQEWNFETDTIPVDGTTLYAKWTPTTYTITLHDGDSVSSVDYNVIMDSLVLGTPSKTGYSFNGWFDESLTTEFKYIKGTTVGNIDVYANFTINQYIIAFNSNGGSAVDSIEADYNVTITEPSAPTKTGYTFAGWFKDNETFLQEWNFETDTIPVDGTTLYAKWTVNSYNVTFHYNNGDNNKTEHIAFNSSITEPTNVSKLGYTLEGWYSDSEFKTPWNFKSNKMPAAELNLYAKWSPDKYNVTFNLNGGSGSISDMEYTIEDRSIALETPTREGYTFEGWYENNIKFEYTPGQTVGDHSLTAKWTAENYTITYMDGSSEITAGSEWPITYTSESETYLPTSATKTGYTFAGWYDNENLSGNAVTSIPAQSTEDKVFYAKWTPITYFVIFNTNGGTGIIENQSFKYDETKNLTANSFEKKGYAFLGWSEDSTASAATYADNQSIMNLRSDDGSSVTLYAVWEVITYHIHYEVYGDPSAVFELKSNGSTNKSTYTVNDSNFRIINLVGSIPYILRDGYTFEKWSIYSYPSGSTELPGTIKIMSNTQIRVNTGTTGDLIVYSHWVPNSYGIIFDLNGGNGENIHVQGDYGNTISKPDTVLIRDGYTFNGNWYKDSDCTNIWDFNVDTVPINGVTLYAGWTSSMNIVTLPNGSVNGYDFTASASAGFDENNVPSGNDFKFDVKFNADLGNYIPIISWNNNTKCPDSQNGLIYQFTVPDVTSSLAISLSIVDTTALKEFVNNATSSEYKLSIDKWTLTVEVSNPNTDASVLINAISAKIGNQEIPVNPDSGRAVTNFLAYLPDDNTLWENNLAEYIVEIGGYKIIFKQDADAIEEAKIRYLTEIAQAVRVFRDNPDYYPLEIGGKSYSEIFSVSAGIKNESYKFIDIGVLQTYDLNTNIQLSLAQALLTNYATVSSLVGHEDALWGRYDLNADFSNAMLKDPVDLNVNLLSTAQIQILYHAALEILKDMQIPIDSAISPIDDCFNNGVGYGGYGKYYCASVETGIRYTDVYHIKFTNYFEESKPVAHAISFSGDVVNEIALQNFAMHNDLVNITFDAHNINGHVLSESGMLGAVLFNENANKTDIYKYELSRLAAGELIVINLNQNSKLTMSDIAVTTSSGANVEWYNSNSFIMPDGDVTISLKTSSEAEAPAIAESPGSLVNMTAGDSVSLTVSASVSDGGILSYAWYAANEPSDTTVDESKKVASSATYTIPVNQSEGVYYYFCVVTNTLGTSSSTSTTNIVTVSITSQTYSISFETNGGSAVNAAAYQNLKQGTPLSLPSSERFGYQFDGWYSDAALSVQAPTTMPANNLTLHAKWNNALSPDGSITTFENDATHPWIVDETMAGTPAYTPSNCGMENTKSILSITVSGPGKVYFLCQSSGIYNSTFFVNVDGSWEATPASDFSWGLKHIDIVASGEHTVTWEYSMNTWTDYGYENKAWIKDIVFVPTGKTTANIDVDIKLPLGSDASEISITGLNLGTNTVSIGSKMPVTVTSPDNLAFVGWQDGNGNWIDLQDKRLQETNSDWVSGNGVDEFITNNELILTAFYDLSMTAVFLKKEQILPEIIVLQNGGSPTKVSDGLKLEYASSANPIFSFDMNTNDSDVNISASLNGSKIEFSGNTLSLQDITEYSELVFTATKNECLTQTLSLFFKPLYTMPNVCLDDSVDSVYTFGYHKWILDSSITDRVAYKSTNQNMDFTWSSFAVEVTGSGKLSFDYCVSSESDYDILLYRFNQEVTSETMNAAANYGNKGKYSGETGWKTEIITITADDAEKTIIYFAYCKEYSSKDGQDTSWISNIRFAQGAKTVTLTAPGSSAGTVTGTYNSSNLNIGENKIDPEVEVSLTAAPNDGYQFYGWIDGNGRLLSLSNTYSFTVLGDVTITAVFALNDTYAARNGGTWYESLEEALNDAFSGDTVVLLKDYTLTQSVTVSNGVFLVLPCSDSDVGYDLTAEYSKEHNPDGTSTSTADLSILYRTLTIPSDVTLTVEGQVLINAVTGRPSGGHYDMDVTGNYSQIILNGNISVENGAILEACGYVKGDGQITAKNGSEVRDTYVVKNWRGGTQASLMYFSEVFPFNEYECNNIQCQLYIESSSSFLGNVKMYADGSYQYTRFPQINQANGLIRLADRSHLIKTYDAAASNGTSAADTGRTMIQIYGGATFSNSTLNIVDMNLSTGTFIYPVDGDISFELHNGNYTFNNDFKFLTGAAVTVDSDATLIVSEGKTVIFYNEFNDVDNVENTKYPDRPAATLTLNGTSTLSIQGTFAGIVNCETNENQVIIGPNAVTSGVTTKEANGYKAAAKTLTFNMDIRTPAA